MPDPLPHLDDSGRRRVLAVVAHPDDMEYGTSAAVATWTAAGIDVAYLLLTSGEAGMAIPPGEAGPLRAGEQGDACSRVGVTDLTILDHPDGMLEHSLGLRRDIAREIRRFRPDTVITAAFGVQAYGGLNQADHRVAGLATIDAIRDADNRWVFPELVAHEQLEPWHVRTLLIAGDDRPTHALPVGLEAVEASVASLAAHRAYLEHLPDHPRPEDFIPRITASGGASAGTDHAVLFRAYDLG